MQITFHRAIDTTPDIFAALQTIASFPGITRVLSSGGRRSAFEGANEIAQMVSQTDADFPHLVVMPGAGITPANIFAIAKATNAKEFHGSFRSVLSTSVPLDRLTMLGLGNRMQTSAALVAAAVSELKTLDENSNS
eukprot:c18281_g1_i1.p1 GENE.c18281_g1_i1~~c18281_g1_i1.p1  ORF type:complete len:136 (+),score=25.43 c18281_g1_i1:271-678(+)